MEDEIAIICVVSSAIVAIVVAVLASRGKARRLEPQISAERLNEVRGVLDEAASALKGALLEMNGIVSLLDEGLEQAPGEGTTVDDLFSGFQDQSGHAARLRERMALRLGPHAETCPDIRHGGRRMPGLLPCLGGPIAWQHAGRSALFTREPGGRRRREGAR